MGHDHTNLQTEREQLVALGKISNGGAKVAELVDTLSIQTGFWPWCEKNLELERVLYLPWNVSIVKVAAHCKSSSFETRDDSHADVADNDHGGPSSNGACQENSERPLESCSDTLPNNLCIDFRGGCNHFMYNQLIQYQLLT